MNAAENIKALEEIFTGGTHIGIDPGIQATGVFVFCQKTSMWATATIRSSTSNTLEDRICHILEKLSGVLGPYGTFDTCTIERMVVYSQREQKGDQAAMVNLSILGGACFQMVQARKKFLPIPGDWKGRVPKNIHQKRLLKNHKAEGLFGKSSDHVVDAFGLAIYGAKKEGMYANP